MVGEKGASPIRGLSYGKHPHAPYTHITHHETATKMHHIWDLGPVTVRTRFYRIHCITIYTIVTVTNTVYAVLLPHYR